jgi:hypothetical protein
MRVKRLGYSSKVKFSDGSEADADIDSVFSSPYMKNKIKEFNDYYIGKKGYRAFKQEDRYKFKRDADQILRQIFNHNFLVEKVEIRMFNKTAIYGVFAVLLAKKIDELIRQQPALRNVSIPFCICYIRENEKGESRVFIRRILAVSVYSEKMSKYEAKIGTGGKEIGTIR